MNRKNWYQEAVFKDVSKYKTEAKWRKNSHKSYAIFRRNKWNDVACAHMTIIKTPNEYVNKELFLDDRRIDEVARKCKTQGESYNTYANAYKIVIAKNWLDGNSHIHTYS